MQVLVAADTIGALSSLQAGRLLATGWSAADASVVAVGAAGAGFVQATADSWGVELTSGMLSGQVVQLARHGGTTLLGLAPVVGPSDGAIPLDASSTDLGQAVSHALELGRPRRLLLDLAGPAVHDGGAGLLAALGAQADVSLTDGVRGLSGIARLDLSAVRERLAGVELVGIVPADQLTRPLLGLRGITSLRRTPDTDPELLLETDAAIESLARLAAPERADVAGAGACGGLGFAVLALGGRLTSGPGYAWESEVAQHTVAGVDLVVTGCTSLDFAHRGGEVVAEAARVAGEQLAPCIVVAGEVLIGGRELRTLGIESAYAVRDASPLPGRTGDVSESELLATARRVGRSWRW